MDEINKGLKLIKKLEIKRLLRSLNIYLFGDFFLYQGWLRRNLNRPSFKIALTNKVMIYICSNSNNKLLKQTLASIKRQTYPYYDVQVITAKDLPTLEINAEYYMFLEAGDRLTSNCLCELIRNIKDNSAIYGDHDIYTTFTLSKPKFKPDFSIDLLRSYPYIHHSVLFKQDAYKKSYETNFDAFLYEQLLHLYAKQMPIGHVPNILFHFKQEICMTSKLIDVLNEHYKVMGLNTEITRSNHYLDTNYLPQAQKASIIIPNKDHYEDLKKCIDSIYKYTDPNLFEIIIVENNSETKEIFDYYEEVKKIENIRVVYWESIFNYSAINNFGVTFANNEFILFMNNDVEVMNNDWLIRMLGDIQREDVGIVGAKLLYGDHKVQHGGVVVGTWGLAAHMFLGQSENYQGYMYRATVKQNMSAVTAACLMTKKSLFISVGGFEEKLKVAFNDIDYCLKISTGEKLVLFDPEIVLIHHESLSRGSDDIDIKKKQRFDSEVDFMKTKWENFLFNGDPYYNKNLTLDRTDYMIR